MFYPVSLLLCVVHTRGTCCIWYVLGFVRTWLFLAHYGLIYLNCMIRYDTIFLILVLFDFHCYLENLFPYEKYF